MSYKNLLNLTVTIQEKTKTQKGQGSVKFDWTTKVASVLSRKVLNLNPRVFDDIAKTYVDQYKFYFLLDVDITISDRILLSDGRIYEVSSIDNDSSSHHQKAYCKITKQ